MIRRSTWVVLALLVVLVGFSFYLKNRQAQKAEATPTESGNSSTVLFNSSEGEPTGIKIQDNTGKSVEVLRNEAGTWVLKAPTDAQADQAAAQAAATQASSLRVLSTVQLGLDIVGLDKPAYTIRLTFGGGKTHTLQVGAETPIQDGYYTSLDNGPVRIVDKQGIDALTMLLTQPPYAVTPTAPATETLPPPVPSETIQPTETPAGAASSTPPVTPATATATP